MSETMKQLQETAAFIKEKINTEASIGIILGSGLGNLASEIKVELEIPYHDIPHFPVSTVEGHKGRLLFGELGDKKSGSWPDVSIFTRGIRRNRWHTR